MMDAAAAVCRAIAVGDAAGLDALLRDAPTCLDSGFRYYGMFAAVWFGDADALHKLLTAGSWRCEGDTCNAYGLLGWQVQTAAKLEPNDPLEDFESSTFGMFRVLAGLEASAVPKPLSLKQALEVARVAWTQGLVHGMDGEPPDERSVRMLKAELVTQLADAVTAADRTEDCCSVLGAELGDLVGAELLEQRSTRELDSLYDDIDSEFANGTHWVCRNGVKLGWAMDRRHCRSRPRM